MVARLEQEEEAAAVAALAELEQELAKEAAAARVTAREKLRARQEAVATLSEQVREGGRERETHAGGGGEGLSLKTEPRGNAPGA